MRWLSFLSLSAIGLLLGPALFAQSANLERPLTSRVEIKKKEAKKVTVSRESLKELARDMGCSYVESEGLIYLVPIGRESDLYREPLVIRCISLNNPGLPERKELTGVFGSTRAGSRSR